MRVRGGLTAGCLALLLGCSESARLETEDPVVEKPSTGKGEALGIDVPSEAEAERAARDAIGPKDFDAELERIKAELRDDR